MYGLVEPTCLLGRQPTLLDDDVEPPLQFVLRFVPLLLGHHYPQIGSGE